MKIAIASGKGGSGKTSLSTNLCALIAESTEVVLADLDVEEPNSALFFPAKFSETIIYKQIPAWDQQNCTLCGNCQEVCNFNAIIQLLDEITVFPELCHSCYACSLLCPESALSMEPKRIGLIRRAQSGMLDILEGRLDIGEEQGVPLIVQSIDLLNKEYGREHLVIIDAPPGSSCPVIEVSRESDLVILVTEPTPFGLNDLKIMVDTLKLLEREMVIVLNRAGKEDHIIEDYCREAGLPLIAKIPDKRKAAELYASGKLMIAELPEIRKEVDKIRQYILTATHKFRK